jgi:hypothetical protein
MKCKQIQYSIYDYIDDVVDQVTRSAIESHLSGCAECRLHYETQRQLHRSVTDAVAGELAGLHFQPASIKAEASGADHRLFIREQFGRVAFALPALLLLYVILWPVIKPDPNPFDDPAQSAYTEAFHYLEMHSANSSGASGFTIPVAVIVRPGAPARIIELDGTTDVSTELK